jgi:hypothetical protein
MTEKTFARPQTRLARPRTPTGWISSRHIPFVPVLALFTILGNYAIFFSLLRPV